MAIITLEKYKLLAGITNDKKDALIEAYIPLVEQDYLAIRNHPFDTILEQVVSETGEPVLDESTGKPLMKEVIVYPKGSELTAFEMLRWKLSPQGKNGVTSESIGSYSYTLGGNTSSGYPADVVSKIKKWARTNVNREF